MRKPLFPVLFCLVFLVLSTTEAFADSTVSPSSSPAYDFPPTWFVSADVSRMWPDLGNSMSVKNGSSFVPPYNSDRYTLSNIRATALSGMAGYQWRADRDWFPAWSLALRYQHMFSETLDGKILQYSLPLFKNYRYRWQISSNIFSVYSKIDLYQYHRFIPFVGLGLGVAINKTGHYNETALSGITARVSPSFDQNTQRKLSYNLGIGLAYRIQQAFEVALSYDYQSLGSVQSGQGEAAWQIRRLDLGQYRINSLRLGLTYYFDNMDLQGK